MHYYSFNVADYRKDTVHLSRLEHSIYRDLIDWYYLDEKPIPLETQSVSRRLRLGSQEELDALFSVLSDFFFMADDGYRHNRIDADIAHYHSLKARNQANGAKGGRPKNPVGSQLKPTGKATNNKELVTINQELVNNKPQRTSAPLCPEGVSEQVWKDYLSVRRAKKSPLTETALKAIEKEAGKAGWSLEKALSECAARGWVGFKAEWVDKLSNPKLSFAERDELLKRKRWEEMTGRDFPEEQSFWNPNADMELLK